MYYCCKCSLRQFYLLPLLMKNNAVCIRSSKAVWMRVLAWRIKLFVFDRYSVCIFLLSLVSLLLEDCVFSTFCVVRFVICPTANAREDLEKLQLIIRPLKHFFAITFPLLLLGERWSGILFTHSSRFGISSCDCNWSLARISPVFLFLGIILYLHFVQTQFLVTLLRQRVALRCVQNQQRRPKLRIHQSLVRNLNLPVDCMNNYKGRAKKHFYYSNEFGFGVFSIKDQSQPSVLF